MLRASFLFRVPVALSEPIAARERGAESGPPGGVVWAKMKRWLTEYAKAVIFDGIECALALDLRPDPDNGRTEAVRQYLHDGNGLWVDPRAIG